MNLPRVRTNNRLCPPAGTAGPAGRSCRACAEYPALDACQGRHETGTAFAIRRNGVRDWSSALCWRLRAEG